MFGVMGISNIEAPLPHDNLQALTSLGSPAGYCYANFRCALWGGILGDLLSAR